MPYPNLTYRTPTPLCEDIQRKLRETEQIYLPELDMPLSITRNLFDLLDAKRKALAKARGVPEIQYDFEDLLFELWRKDPDNVPEARQQHTDPEELKAKLSNYAREVTPGGSMRFLITPDVPYGLDWTATTPHILEVVILLAKDEDVIRHLDQEEVVAVFAHEAGHLEQNRDMREMRPILPPLEVDAWRRGIKWAHKWGVLPEYSALFLESVAKTPEQHLATLKKDIERIKIQIKELLK